MFVRISKRFTVGMMLSVTILLGWGGAPAQGQAQDACTPASGEPIQIGMVFPQGALFSVRTAAALQGAQAMLAAVNACGGMNGQPVEALIEAANGRDEAEAAAMRLVEAGVGVIVGSGSVAVSEGLQTVAEREGVVLWEVTESLTEPGDWSYSPRPGNSQLGRMAGEFVAQELAAFLGESPDAALVYENRPRGDEVARGIRTTVGIGSLLEEEYTDDLTNSFDLARRIRDDGLDVVMIAAFDSDAAALWRALREVDANIAGWVYIGSDAFGRDRCSRFGNYDSFIAVSSYGPVSQEYRSRALGELYTHYRRAYVGANIEEPTPEADLAASGVYLLLRYIFPAAESTGGAGTMRSAARLRFAIERVEVPPMTGLMGEGYLFDVVTRGNHHGAAVIQQRQQGRFCTVWPADIATCSGGLIAFPTWRERAIIAEQATCSDPA